MKLHLILAIVALLISGVVSAAFALHDGGVARCEACHTTHNSLGNAVHDADLTT